MPTRDFAVGVERRFGFDQTRGAEIGPSEFLRAHPTKRDRFFRGLSELSRFYGALAGMLAAKTAAKIGRDDADVFFGDAKRAGLIRCGQQTAPA